MFISSLQEFNLKIDIVSSMAKPIAKRLGMARYQLDYNLQPRFFAVAVFWLFMIISLTGQMRIYNDYYSIKNNNRFQLYNIMFNTKTY